MPVPVTRMPPTRPLIVERFETLVVPLVVPVMAPAEKVSVTPLAADVAGAERVI